MNYSDAQIKEIADSLEAGFICYVHRQTGEVLEVPDVSDPFSGEFEAWYDVLNQVEQHPEDYLKIKPMDSTQAYQVMADFAEELPEGDFRERALDRLSARKPFRNFKDLVEDSEYREDWFAFRTKAYQKWVREQL